MPDEKKVIGYETNVEEQLFFCPNHKPTINAAVWFEGEEKSILGTVCDICAEPLVNDDKFYE